MSCFPASCRSRGSRHGALRNTRQAAAVADASCLTDLLSAFDPTAQLRGSGTCWTAAPHLGGTRLVATSSRLRGPHLGACQSKPRKWRRSGGWARNLHRQVEAGRGRAS
eukprot:363429-Chlamydomonas_euryale.AAC.19